MTPEEIEAIAAAEVDALTAEERVQELTGKLAKLTAQYDYLWKIHGEAQAERDRLAEQAAEGEARLHAALVDLDIEGVNLNALTVDELHQMLTTAMRGPAGGA